MSSRPRRRLPMVVSLAQSAHILSPRRTKLPSYER